MQTKNTRCAVKGILIQALGLKTVKTCPFQHSPHMLDSTNITNSPILWWSRFLGGRITILKEDPALYPHTCLGLVTYMRTIVNNWATQCLAWGSTLHAVEAISLSMSSTNTAVGR